MLSFRVQKFVCSQFDSLLWFMVWSKLDSHQGEGQRPGSCRKPPALGHNVEAAPRQAGAGPAQPKKAEEARKAGLWQPASNSQGTWEERIYFK